MQRDLVMRAFEAEAEQLSAAMYTLDKSDWARATAFDPWTVRDLLGHVSITVGRVPSMLGGEAPPRATVSAVGYYRHDSRFSPETNDRRIETAREYSALMLDDDGGLLRSFDEAWRYAFRLCASEPDNRVVRTRHGDPMLLIDFVTTRVVEMAVHALDLAAAVQRPPWLTAAAAELLTALLTPFEGRERVRRLAWDPATFIAKATGRLPVSGAENAELEHAGIRRLALG